MLEDSSNDRQSLPLIHRRAHTREMPLDGHTKPDRDGADRRMHSCFYMRDLLGISQRPRRRLPVEIVLEPKFEEVQEIARDKTNLLVGNFPPIKSLDKDMQLPVTSGENEERERRVETADVLLIHVLHCYHLSCPRVRPHHRHHPTPDLQSLRTRPGLHIGVGRKSRLFQERSSMNEWVRYGAKEPDERQSRQQTWTYRHQVAQQPERVVLQESPHLALSHFVTAAQRLQPTTTIRASDSSISIASIPPHLPISRSHCHTEIIDKYTPLRHRDAPQATAGLRQHGD